MTTTEKSIADSIENIIVKVGENPNREGLLHTPERFSEYIHFATSGYTQKIEDVIGTGIFTETLTDDVILIKDIDMFSTCEHHLLPFFGKVHIAYTPNKKILGLSKFARIVEMYSRRFQVQERLTKEIAETIQLLTESNGVLVGIEAVHLCMMMRGVQKMNSKTITTCKLGNIVCEHMFK